MTREALRQMMFQTPFKPFRVTLVTGEELEIRQPYSATTFGASAVFGVGDDPAAARSSQMRIVPISDILQARAA